MSKNAKRRLLIMICLIIACIAVLLLSGIFDSAMEPSAYEYYIKNVPGEAEMPNAVTAIYLRYRIFDTLFEALLLAMAVSAVVYFAAAWERGKEEHKDDL
jgi:multicomponent Na+:H+ antiporter subunit B